MAPNIAAILEWVRANRPDTLESIESIVRQSQEGSRHADGLLLLLVMGLQAGRQYQINHPELGVHSYHTDDPRLPRHPPVKTE